MSHTINLQDKIEIGGDVLIVLYVQQSPDGKRMYILQSEKTDKCYTMVIEEAIMYKEDK